MLNIEKIQKQIELRLINTSDNQIIINDKIYLETIMFNYKLDGGDINFLLNQNQHKANNILDVLERNELMNFFYSYDFLADVNTRQAVCQPKYQEDNAKSACIASIQMLLRNGEVNLNVNMRSSNYAKNWLYDQQTFALIMERACLKYNLSRGYIYVVIGSLHLEISDTEIL